MEEISKFYVGSMSRDVHSCTHWLSRVSTEFRRHGISSVFFTSVYSVFRAEVVKIPVALTPLGIYEFGFWFPKYS
jgi:hypothetical protein